MSVRNQLIEIEKQIQVAKRSKSAYPGEITVIAVSKKQTVETVREAVDSGLRNFGENYLQEALQKQKDLHLQSLQWHFIGSLQSKKVRQVCENFHWIHSVDRLKLAEAIHHASEGLEPAPKVFMQLNLAGEESKSGLSETELWPFLNSVRALSNIRWAGFMLMPPFVGSAEENRPLFRRARELLMEAKERFSFLSSEEFVHLSMGTSQDYPVAIEEGATMVRIGTRLLGEREYRDGSSD